MPRKRLTEERKMFLKVKKRLGVGFADKIHSINPNISKAMIYWVFSGSCKNPEMVANILTLAKEVAESEKEKKKNYVALADIINKI